MGHAPTHRFRRGLMQSSLSFTYFLSGNKTSLADSAYSDSGRTLCENSRARPDKQATTPTHVLFRDRRNKHSTPHRQSAFRRRTSIYEKAESCPSRSHLLGVRRRNP